jgi:hypothetical protein
MRGGVMIRIDRGKEVAPGIWEYAILSLGLSGKSRQPLLMPVGKLNKPLGRPNRRACVPAFIGRATPSRPSHAWCRMALI